MAPAVCIPISLSVPCYIILMQVQNNNNNNNICLHRARGEAKHIIYYYELFKRQKKKIVSKIIDSRNEIEKRLPILNNDQSVVKLLIRTTNVPISLRLYCTHIYHYIPFFILCNDYPIYIWMCACLRFFYFFSWDSYLHSSQYTYYSVVVVSIRTRCYPLYIIIIKTMVATVFANFLCTRNSFPVNWTIWKIECSLCTSLFVSLPRVQYTIYARKAKEYI